MMRYVAVIDLGKTNSKVALVDTRQAKEINVIRQPTVALTDGPYLSLDQAGIHRFILSSLKTLQERASIDAITVTTHGATVALLDASGALAMPVLDYECTEVDDLRDVYDTHRPAFRETGSPELPGGLNIGAQLFWQQHHFPEQFERVDTVLTWPQYWVYVLTGQKNNDVTSLGCHSDLYLPRQQAYSGMVEALGWRSIMPFTVNSGQFAGPLTESIAAQTGLAATTPVYTGIHDSNASLVPHLMTEQETLTVVSTGTWFIVMAIAGDDKPLDRHRDTLLNVNAKGQTVPSARFMGGRERELLHDACGITPDSVDATAMEALLHGDSTPVMLLPSAVSGTGPYPNSQLNWVNLPTPADDAKKACAITLYLALMTFESMQLVGGNGPTYVEGPLAHDNYFVQMLAAVSDRPVYISESETGTSVGAAMLINAPTDPPVYNSVTLSDQQRSGMALYASRWQQLLQHHAM